MPSLTTTKYTGPAKAVPVCFDPFDDVWLGWAFSMIAVAFVFIVFVLEL